MYSRSVKIFPAECRQRAATYKAKMSVTLCWRIDGQSAGSMDKVVGHVPIMVKVHLYMYMYYCIQVLYMYMYLGIHVECMHV